MSDEQEIAPELVALWDDNPSALDLLGFEDLTAPILAALASRDLDPITIGIHGPWGSGKSTLLRVLEDKLRNDGRYVVVSTSPWEYEDHNDVKGTLIGVVLDALDKRAKGPAAWAKRTRRRIRDLSQRVSWSRVGAALARGAIMMGWNAPELLEAFALRPKEPRDLVGFRSEFGEMVRDLKDVDRVVVLVDDLDRCLPTAVVQTLEAIKLFLSVPRMVFLLAADKELVTDAIAAHLPASNRSERIASNYLEKIIQLPISLPRVASHDAEAYIGLLLSARQAGGDADALRALAAHCDARRAANSVPLLYGFSDELSFRPSDSTLRLTAQIAAGLGADRSGNPRMIKRFLNAFGVRRSIAAARGIKIDAQVLAKLMILEERYPEAFEKLASIDWGEQRVLLKKWEDWARSAEEQPPDASLRGTKAWASSEPPLADQELGPYLTLAASLASRAVRVAISEELAAIVRRMVGESDADREVACEEALKKSPEERRQILQGLYEQLRRAEDVTRPARVLVTLAEGDPSSSDEISQQLAALDGSLFTPAIAVTIVGSKAEALAALAQGLLGNEKVPAETKNAIKELIE